MSTQYTTKFQLSKKRQLKSSPPQPKTAQSVNNKMDYAGAVLTPGACPVGRLRCVPGLGFAGNHPLEYGHHDPVVSLTC